MKILEHLRRTNSLRIRVFVPLILALIFLLGSMTLILEQSQHKVLQQELAAKTKEAEKLFLEYQEEEAKKLSLALSTLTLNKELTTAFKSRDRVRLHDLTQSYFERLRSHYDVTHLYFTGPDRVNILRLHQPDRFGDRIDRFTTLEAEKTGKESQGIELGPLGTFTLRVVRPWYDGERLLGYVELGMETEHVLKELRGILDSSVYVFIHKDFIQREGWEAGIRMLGHKEEWGHFPDTVIIGEPLDQVPEKAAQVIAGKQPLQPETVIHSNGTYYRVAFIPLIDAGKREIGHISILLDETAGVSAFHRSVLLICIFYVLVGAALFVFFYAFLGQIEKKQKWMEESRLEFEQGFRIIFDNANDGIMLADIETKKFTLGNKMMCSMLGYGPEEIKTLGVADIHPEKDLPRVIDHFARIQRKEFAIAEQLPVKRKDGTVFYADISASPVTLGGKSYLVGIFRDITERTKTENALRESEEHFRFLNDLAGATRTLADPEQIMAVMSRMLGEHLHASRCAYADVEKDGEQFTILHDYTDGCASTVGNYQLSLFGARAVTTLQSGEILIIRNVETELLPGEGADMFNAIGIKAIITCPLVKDGGLRAMMAVHQTTPRDWKSGEVAIVQEVVERCWATIERRTAEEKIRKLNEDLEFKVEEKTRELLDAQEELVRKEKLSILGQLSGSVGHELRNPLAVMSNAVYFLKTVLTDADETTREYLEIIKHEIDISLRIITDLLDFARTRTPQKSPVTPEELVRQSLERCSIPDNVSVTVDVPDGLPRLNVDLPQMGQVLTNFITNGVQAMPDGGALRVAVRRGAGGRRNADSRFPIPEEDFVEISVADSGEGISPENMKKLFQPLFTTKAKGIGLGLVVCRNLVEANGGRIKVASELRKGTTFTVEFPIERGRE